jgi:hypothetical protein
MSKTLGLLGVPSSAGAFAPGQEKAPQAMRQMGLVTALRATGVAVVDHGDSPIWRWRPDQIAILGSIGAAVYRGALTDAIPAAAPPDAASAVRDTLGGAVVAASQLSDPLGAVLLAAAREAFVQGLHLIGIVSAVVMTGMAVAVAVVLGRGGAGAHPEALPADETTDEATAVGRVA